MRVERLHRVFDIEVIYRHFPLHPDTPREGLTLERLFAGRGIDIPAANARMAGLMQQEGLPYSTRSMTFNSRLAQELAAWSETQPNGGAIHDALFRAYFVDNVNLADLDELIAIVDRLGLSAEAAEEILVQRRFREAVDADWQRSHDLGVTSVPTFVLGNHGLVGAQSYEQLEELLIHSGVMRRMT